MRKYLIVAWALLLMLPSALAQEEKLRVAVLDPTASGASIDENTKLAVQELISSTFVNTGKYVMIERSMIDKIMKEQAFQNSDMADNSQATELGKLVGASKVVLSAVSLVSGRNMLSIKVIDVQTATIDQQKTKIVNANDLLDVVEPLTLELLGEEAVYKKQETQFLTQEDKKAAEKKAEEERIAAEKKAEEERKAAIVKDIIFEGKPNKKSNKFFLGEYTMQLSVDGEVLENGISAVNEFSVLYKDKKPGIHVFKAIFSNKFTSSITVNTALYDRFVFQTSADFDKATLTLLQTINSTPNNAEGGQTENADAVSLPTANEGELSLYCAGFIPGNSADGNMSVIVKLDGKVVGNTTMNKGFSLKLDDSKVGKHKIQINEDEFKVDTKKKRDFTFMVKRVEATSGSTVSVGFIPIKTKGKEAGYKFVLID